MKIVFLGDISLNGRYQKFQSDNINPFSEINKDLVESNLVIGNLESICKSSQGFNPLKNPRLYTNEETLELLKFLNLSVGTLAHNHIYDNLKEGISITIDKLKTLDIAFLGAHNDETRCVNSLSIEEGIVFLNYLNLDTNPHLPEDAKIALSVYDINKITQDIEQFKKVGKTVIVLLHWGGRCEDGFFPDFQQKEEAKKMIDAGADLIIGGHSHTLQPVMKYKGKYIFFSLGNFCFDDIESEGTKKIPIGNGRTKRSILLKVLVTSGGISYSVVPIRNKNGHIIHGSNLSILMWRIRSSVVFPILSIKPFWKLYYLSLKKIYPYYFFIFRMNVPIKEKVHIVFNKFVK